MRVLDEHEHSSRHVATTTLLLWLVLFVRCDGQHVKVLQSEDFTCTTEGGSLFFCFRCSLLLVIQSIISEVFC